MSYEVWVFSDRPEFRSRGGLVMIEVCPREYSLGDAEQYARKIEQNYAAEGRDVSALARREASY